MADIKMEEKEQLTDKEQRNVLYRLLSYTKQHKKELILAFSLLVITTLGELAGPYLVKIFIDDYLTPGNLEFQPLLILGASYLGIQIVKVNPDVFSISEVSRDCFKNYSTTPD